MDPSFWRTKWQKGEIGFHRDAVNPYLESYGDRLSGRVFVPLAGKSVDLTWLAERGRQVVAVELVEAALEAYFSERGVAYDRRPDGAWVGGGVEAYAADIFALRPDTVGPIDSWYDRAALIALPPNRREAYLSHVMRFLPAGAPGLVVTLDYGATPSRPPFPISAADAARLLGAYGKVEHLQTEEKLHENEHFRSRGTDWLLESVWAFERG